MKMNMRSSRIILCLVAILVVLFFLGFFGMKEGFRGPDCSTFSKPACIKESARGEGMCMWNSTTNACGQNTR